VLMSPRYGRCRKSRDLHITLGAAALDGWKLSKSTILLGVVEVGVCCALVPSGEVEHSHTNFVMY
jgi:hypothetical protein